MRISLSYRQVWAVLLLLVLAVTAAFAQQRTQQAIDLRNVINADRILPDRDRIAVPDSDNSRVQPTPVSQNVDLSKYKSVLTDARFMRFDAATGQTVEIAGDAAARIDVGEYIAVASDELEMQPISRAPGQDYTALPGLILTKFSDGSIGQLRVDLFSEGFSWRKNDGAFQASIFVKVSNFDDPNAGDTLNDPIPVRISGTDLNDPQLHEVEIARLGFRGEQQVIVQSDAENIPVSVTMRHAVNPDDQRVVELPVDKPEISISANPPDIAGFGIESTEIIVDSRGKLPDGFKLVLDSDKGNFEPKQVTIDTSGTATSRLWSAGVGSVAISVLDDRFTVDSEPVKYKEPYGFLLAGALGSALGATFIFLRQRSRGTASPWSWGANFVFGIGITIAVFAGFDIPKMLDLPAGRTGLVVVFATGFIASVLTSTIFSALTGGGGKGEPA